MTLGTNIPHTLFTTKPKEWKFHNSHKGEVVRYVGAEIEFNNFLAVPSAASIITLQKALRGWGGSVVQDHSNAEVQLAPAKGEKFEEQAREICGLLSTMRAKCTSISGLHIHVDARDMKFSHLGRVMTFYSKMEPLLIKTQPFLRMAGKFCKPTGKEVGEGWGEVRLTEEQEKLFEEKSKAYISTQAPGLSPEQVARYKAVNFASWYKYGTIEVRFHEGTIDPDKIIRWATFWSRFVEFASSTPIDTLRKLPRTQTTLTKAVGEEACSYIKERLAAYKNQWTPERVDMLMPKPLSGEDCELCREDGAKRTATGQCCDMQLCDFHMTDH